jgi:hypothetical protein
MRKSTPVADHLPHKHPPRSRAAGWRVAPVTATAKHPPRRARRPARRFAPLPRVFIELPVLTTSSGTRFANALPRGLAGPDYRPARLRSARGRQARRLPSRRLRRQADAPVAPAPPAALLRSANPKRRAGSKGFWERRQEAAPRSAPGDRRGDYARAVHPVAERGPKIPSSLLVNHESAPRPAMQDRRGLARGFAARGRRFRPSCPTCASAPPAAPSRPLHCLRQFALRDPAGSCRLRRRRTSRGRFTEFTCHGMATYAPACARNARYARWLAPRRTNRR